MAVAITTNDYNNQVVFHYNDNDDDNCMCPGFYFEPKDDQIIGCFLTYIAKGYELPALANEHIRFVDIYGDLPPWDIFSNDIPATKVFHVITPLKYWSQNSNRIKRTVGGGTWKGQSTREKIKIDGEVVGEKYTLSFMMEKKSTHWNMTEYCLLDYSESTNNRTQKVFCRIVYSGKQLTTTTMASMPVPVCGGKRPIDDIINNSIITNNDAILPSQSRTGSGSEDQEDSAALADQEIDDYFLNEINFYNHVDDYFIQFTDCDIDDIADNSRDEEPSQCPTSTTIAAAAILASDDEAIITGSEEKKKLDAFVSYLETQFG